MLGKPNLTLNFTIKRGKLKFVCLALICALGLFTIHINIPLQGTSLTKESKVRAETFPSNLPQVHVKEVICAPLFTDDNAGYQWDIAEDYLEKNPKIKIPDQEYIKITSDCEQFKTNRRYITAAISQEEEDFSIAFSIAMHKDVEQVERLLLSIYRPSNFYCIHVDGKSAGNVYEAMEAISKCFDNVFMASRRVNVKPGTESVLEADLVCMKDLLERSRKWRYFINLTGQEFPLKTNLELVRILKAYNGANDVERVKMTSFLRERTEYVWRGDINTKEKKTPFDHHIHISKGSSKIAVSRGFVDYAINDKIAQDFRDWLRDTYTPEETFFSSLNHSPDLGIPGSYSGPFLEDGYQESFACYVAWEHFEFCAGYAVNGLCIFGVGDLESLVHRREFFASKFYLDHEQLALDCMEERHYNRTREQYLESSPSTNVSFYENLNFVLDHV